MACFRSCRRLYRLFLLSFLALFTALGTAQAHFQEGTQVRTILVTDTDGALVAHVRVPAPLVFSDLIGKSQVDLVPLISPFLAFETTGAGNRYRLDRTAIAENRQDFERRLNGALIFSQAGRDLTSHLTGFTVHNRRPTGPLDSQANAPEATKESVSRLNPVFGQAVIDYVVRLESQDPSGTLSIRSGYAPLLTGAGIAIDNHLIDARIDPPVSTTSPGQLETPAVMDGSRLSTFLHFLHQGTLHILEGLDHVLLVIALALGVGATRKLIYLVTAFTLGHSVTLIATFLGATPAWPWFIPAVEAAIAASVLYAALAALLHRTGSIVIFAAIGLLHGLGFSFVLGDILGRNAPDLVPALLAFNVGIEVGQLLILAATLAAVYLLKRLSEPALQPVRFGTLAAIAILSLWWMVERVPAVIQSA